MDDFNPLAAWAYGVVVGVLVQGVASRIRHNGRWDKVPLGLKVAMSLTGGISAAVAGLYLLDNPDPSSDVPFVYRLWLWQIVAGWAGGMLLDAAARILRRVVNGEGPGGG